MSNHIEELISKSIRVLKSKGILLYPTDTIWGLGCDATDDGAVRKIIEIKNRPIHKEGFVILLASPHQLLHYVDQYDPSVFNYIQSQSKPTTIIYKKGIGVSPHVLAHDGSIAIRICQHPFCKGLIEKLGKPIVSTSANISDTPSPLSFKNISPIIKTKVNYIVEYEQDKTSIYPASQIAKWENGQPFVIRP